MGAGTGGGSLARQRMIAIVIAMTSDTILSRAAARTGCVVTGQTDIDAGQHGALKCETRRGAFQLLTRIGPSMAGQAIEHAMRRMRETGFPEPNLRRLRGLDS